MKPILIFLVSFLFGCVTVASDVKPRSSKTRPVNTFIDPAFVRYVEDFELAFGKFVDVYMGFEEDLDNGNHGECWRFTDGYREVVINSKGWDRMTILQRRALIFHELGHCVFDMKHDDSLKFDGCAKSLMYPHPISQRCLRQYWRQYESEFQNHDRGK
jgi:hypothetical protein